MTARIPLRARMFPGSCRILTPLLRDISLFSRTSQRPLRWYQAECARAIARSVMKGEGKTFTVMFARQMGKNEASAQLEAYLMTLFAVRGGTIVKAAPSFKPQIINSIMRLKETLDLSPVTRGRWKPAFGYMVRLGRCTTTFLSADKQANVVGATASLLLEIDEAQDVDPGKYDRDFRPMASSTNATTVLYGTAWSEDSILERQKQINLRHEGLTGERLHFEYDWTVLAALNPAYKRFVEGEMARLGTDHPSIRTQYLLQTMLDAGGLFSAEQRAALHGMHGRQREPVEGTVYVAGIDIAGEDEQAEDAEARLLAPRRDSTVITIGAVERDGTGAAVLRIVEHLWWTGRDHVRQFANLLELWERWNFSQVCVDASGMGAGLASFLNDRYPERVEKVVFSAPIKSKLAYTMLAMTNTNRVSVYKEGNGEGTSPEAREFWKEIQACRYQLRANEQIAWSVPETEGHDDFVVSLALCCRAAEALTHPAAGALVRPIPDGERDAW